MGQVFGMSMQIIIMIVRPLPVYYDLFTIWTCIGSMLFDVQSLLLSVKLKFDMLKPILISLSW